MIISLNWLKKFTDIDMSVDELATLIGARLVEIEGITNLGEKYDKILVVKVVEASKLDGSDHLSLTKIDDGGVTLEIERDENGYIQVVCGAPNIKSGQMVVWLPPSSIVPETINDAEPFTLGSRKLCGAMSNGMIASAKELALFDEHEGILVVDDDIASGTLFARAYELDDYLLDIENKSLTHRPDCFGIIGFAREVAAIQGKSFKTPDWLMNVIPDFDKPLDEIVELCVNIDDETLSSRYQAIVMSGADGSRQSPLMTQIYLSRVGVRPISAVVDVTNYLMLLTGQPLHAFDYDKLVSVAGGRAEIHVRRGVVGEKLTLLDGRTIELESDDIVIAAGETAVGLAGAMGGANTEIDENTKKIIIESATFNLYNLRATQMRHGIFSEAITRFTKGQPAALTAPVLYSAVKLMEEWSGAKCVSEVAESYPAEKSLSAIEINNGTVNNILGSDFTMNQIAEILQHVEFNVEQSGENNIEITAPYWRADIHIVEDIVEEIGRLNGFDSLNTTLPKRDFIAIRPVGFDIFRDKLRKVLVCAGANEVLGYSFIHGDTLKKVGQSNDNSYRIVNSISPELQYYRQSLTPGLLGLVHPNIKQGYDKFALFEINKSHRKQDGLNEENVPIEIEATALIVANKNKQSGAAYYQAKYLLDYISQRLGLELVYVPIGAESTDPSCAPFEYRRSAIITGRDGKVIGVAGEYKKSVIKSFKLPLFAAGFEIDTMALFELYRNRTNNYTPLSRYPDSDRDICFQVNENINYDQIINAAGVALSTVSLESRIAPVDIYQQEDSQVKNVTIRVKLTSRDHTLTGGEISDVVRRITNSVIAETEARVV